ncbi:cytochrome b561 [Nitzschia inconspicua]|uniref:Cytochrome b561 n=1 Tax=Nitzschia inconspicua TaxID=303405 RepID=A0A9K3KJX7_9STRA|nr:cytochrome b561 [Nitzschia inconspicua]
MSDDSSTYYALIHGILMGLAWLFLAPLAVGASLVRRFQSPTSGCCHQNGLWFRIHFYCQLMVVGLTIAGFLVIWLGGDDDGDGGDDRRRRFLKDWDKDDDILDDIDDGNNSRESVDMDGGSSDSDSVLIFPSLGWTYAQAEESIHPKIGISIVALSIFQAFLGLIRPHVHPTAPAAAAYPPPPPGVSTTTTTTTTTTGSNDDEKKKKEDERERECNTDDGGGSNNNNDRFCSSARRDKDGDTVATTVGAVVDDTTTSTTTNQGSSRSGIVEETDRENNKEEEIHDLSPLPPPPTPTKTTIRIIWEWCHRILGLSLLATSWLQCTVGIKVFRAD